MPAIITEYVQPLPRLLYIESLNHSRYRKFAGAKFRPLDEAYIASFNAVVAGQILKGKEMVYHPLAAETMLPTPPPSEKSVNGDDQELELQGGDFYGVGQILAV